MQHRVQQVEKQHQTAAPDPREPSARSRQQRSRAGPCAIHCRWRFFFLQLAPETSRAAALTGRRCADAGWDMQPVGGARRARASHDADWVLHDPNRWAYCARTRVWCQVHDASLGQNSKPNIIERLGILQACEATLKGKGRTRCRCCSCCWSGLGRFVVLHEPVLQSRAACGFWTRATQSNPTPKKTKKSACILTKSQTASATHA